MNELCMKYTRGLQTNEGDVIVNRGIVKKEMQSMKVYVGSVL